MPYVIIAGGGKVGFYVAKVLSKEKDYEVLIIEKSQQRYNELVDRLSEDKVLLGDATSVEVLKQAGISRADIVVALTPKDEDNLIICQLAKWVFLINKTIAKVNDPANEELFKKLGVTTTINSTNIIFSAIVRELLRDYIPLLSLENGKINLVEVKIQENSKWKNKKIMDIPLPKGCLFLCIVRQQQPEIIRGYTLLKEGDSVIILVPAEREKDLINIL